MGALLRAAVEGYRSREARVRGLVLGHRIGSALKGIIATFVVLAIVPHVSFFWVVVTLVVGACYLVCMAVQIALPDMDSILAYDDPDEVEKRRAEREKREKDDSHWDSFNPNSPRWLGFDD